MDLPYNDLHVELFPYFDEELLHAVTSAGRDIPGTQSGSSFAPATTESSMEHGMLGRHSICPSDTVRVRKARRSLVAFLLLAATSSPQLH